VKQQFQGSEADTALFTVILRKLFAASHQLAGKHRSFSEEKQETWAFLEKVGRFLKKVRTFTKNRLPLIRNVEGFSKNLAMKLINRHPFISNVKRFMTNVAMILMNGERFTTTRRQKERTLG
jgi:hypothetical protein